MRKQLLFWLLALRLLSMNGQNLNVARHSNIDNAYNLISINSKFYYLERTLPQCGNDSTNIVCLGASAQVVSKFRIAFHEYNYPVKILRTMDNCILAVGHSNGCDYYNQTSKNFMIKIDTNGIVKFQTVAQFFYNNLLDDFKDFIQYTDSSYYLVSDSMLYHYTKSGQFISKVNTGLNGINCIAVKNNGNLLFNGKVNGILKNVEMTLTNSISIQQSANNIITAFVQSNLGNIYGLTANGIIEELNPSLILINTSIASLGSNIILRSFFIKNDTLFLTGINNFSNTAFYGILDQNLNSLYQVQSNFKNTFPTGITLDNKAKVNIITKTTNTISPQVSFIGFFQFPKFGTFVSSKDVGVESFSVISSAYTGEISQVYVINLNVKVKNYTSDTLKSFYLNSESFSMGCCNTFLHKLYKQTILPNSSINVQTGDFYNRFRSPINPINNLSYQKVCLYTTVPNGKNDSEIDNDGACISIPITITDLTEIGNHEDGIKIFPNPFNTDIQIASDHEISKIEIYNTSGSLIHENALKNKQYSFDSSEFPNGLYLLKIETEKGVVIKKMLRE